MKGIASLLLLGAIVAAGDARAGAAFSRAAWLAAPHSRGQAWSRAAMLGTLPDLDGMTRRQIVALLGEPGYAATSYQPGAGRTGRIDVYRLSAKNDQSFRIDYDAAGIVILHLVEQNPCACAACSARAPAVPQSALHNAINGASVAAFEVALGQRGERSFSRVRAGGQMWISYADVWRVADRPGRYVIATGQRPARDWRPGALDGEPIASYALISVAPECVAP